MDTWTYKTETQNLPDSLEAKARALPETLGAATHRDRGEALWILPFCGQKSVELMMILVAKLWDMAAGASVDLSECDIVLDVPLWGLWKSTAHTIPTLEEIRKPTFGRIEKGHALLLRQGQPIGKIICPDVGTDNTLPSLA